MCWVVGSQSWELDIGRYQMNDFMSGGHIPRVETKERVCWKLRTGRCNVREWFALPRSTFHILIPYGWPMMASDSRLDGGTHDGTVNLLTITAKPSWVCRLRGQGSATNRQLTKTWPLHQSSTINVFHVFYILYLSCHFFISWNEILILYFPRNLKNVNPGTISLYLVFFYHFWD